jgi:pyridoxamine 5'-phosphate oxidase
MNLDEIREDYKKSTLTKKEVNKNPLLQVQLWLNEAIKAKVSEPTAMVVSTFGENNFPESRIVLLKDINEKGLVFFTNYQSNKGKSILKNAQISLLFFWPEFERQIRINGFAEKTSREISDNYFASRPYESQIGALASEQSKKIESRKMLENKFKKELENHITKTVLRPHNWGGFLVTPVYFEFWQGRPGRLHDRIIFEMRNNSWEIYRLQP